MGFVTDAASGLSYLEEINYIHKYVMALYTVMYMDLHIVTLAGRYIPAIT